MSTVKTEIRIPPGGEERAGGGAAERGAVHRLDNRRRPARIAWPAHDPGAQVRPVQPSPSQMINAGQLLPWQQMAQPLLLTCCCQVTVTAAGSIAGLPGSTRAAGCIAHCLHLQAQGQRGAGGGHGRHGEAAGGHHGAAAADGGAVAGRRGGAVLHARRCRPRRKVRWCPYG